jgi:conjugative transfer region protein TrbK
MNMEIKSLSRFGAIAFVGVAIAFTALKMQTAPTVPTDSVTMVLDDSDSAPLREQLRRCQAIGAAGANDETCLRAWVQNRSRFFMSNVAANAQLEGDPDRAPLGNDSDALQATANTEQEPPLGPILGGRR